MRKSTFFALFILSFSFSICAQTTTIWKGGKPGRTTDWNCPSNWSEGRVPDEFTQVIIPFGVIYYPVIQSTETPIDALLMEGGTLLTIKDGAELVILCETGIFEGVSVFGQIRNEGTLTIREASTANIAFIQHVKGNGIIRSSVTSDTLLTQRR